MLSLALPLSPSTPNPAPKPRRKRREPTPADALDRALSRLRWARHGLELRRDVVVGGERVEWAIAGQLADGRPVRLAIRVRPTPAPLEVLAEELSDDRVAAAGFEVLGLREWQLRFPGACALGVADHCRRLAPQLQFPASPYDADDDQPLRRLQARPETLTPREASPRWELREAVRLRWPFADAAELLARYRAEAIAMSQANDDEDEGDAWRFD